MACARLSDSTSLKKILDVFWGAIKGSIAHGITIDVPHHSNPYVLCGLAQANASLLRPSSMTCCSQLSFEETGSAFLVAGLLDAFVTAFNLRRTNRGPGLNFKELMMTTLCPAWAHTYQATCLGFDPEQLRPKAFPLPKPKRKFAMLPPRRVTTRMTGIESPWLATFTDGGLKRKIDGIEMTLWGVAVVSLEKFVRVMCGPVVCDPRVPAFLGATSCSNNTAELTGLAEVFDGLISSFPLLHTFCLP